MNWNIYITRQIPQAGIQLLEEKCKKIDINPHDRPLTKNELLHEVKNRDGIICLLTDTIDSEVLEAANKATVFSNYAVGFDNVDIETATKRRIMITNTPGVLTDATADMTWALLFAATRRITESDQFTRAGKFKGWGPMLLLGSEIYGKTLGIIGTGRIGTAVALRSSGFNMNVLYANIHSNESIEENLNAQKVSLEQLLKRSDFISLHVPLLPETFHLIGKPELSLMKKTAILINTSRGPVINENALAEALKNKTISGAGLDVFENEPKIHEELLKLQNVVLTPHTGSATTEARSRMSIMAAENLLAGLKGQKSPNLVNPQVLK